MLIKNLWPFIKNLWHHGLQVKKFTSKKKKKKKETLLPGFSFECCIYSKKNKNMETWNGINAKCVFVIFLQLIVCGVYQRPVSKSMIATLITVFVLYVHSQTLCCITNSDTDSSRSHPSYDWHRTKTSPAIKWPSFTGFRATSFKMGDHVPGHFEVVRVCRKSFCRHYFFLLQLQNRLSISDHATLDKLSIGCFGFISGFIWWQIRIHKFQKLLL